MDLSFGLCMSASLLGNGSFKQAGQFKQTGHSCINAGPCLCTGQSKCLFSLCRTFHTPFINIYFITVLFHLY